MATTAATKASFTALGLAGGFAVSALAAPHVAAEDHAWMNHATSPTVGYGTVDVANALLAALMPVARCLDMRDATTGKVYDVEIKTIGSQFTTSAIAMRLARNSAMVYSQVVGKWITEMAEIEAEADLHKGVYQRPVPVIQWAEPRKRAMQGFVRETCVQLARRLLERAAVAFLDARTCRKMIKDYARSATRKCVRASWEHGDLTRAGKALSMASTYARANVIVAGGEFIVASTIMAFFCRALYSSRRSGKGFDTAKDAAKDDDKDDEDDEDAGDASAASLPGLAASEKKKKGGKKATVAIDDSRLTFVVLELYARMLVGNAARGLCVVAGGAVGAGLVAALRAKDCGSWDPKWCGRMTIVGAALGEIVGASVGTRAQRSVPGVGPVVEALARKRK